MARSGFGPGRFVVNNGLEEYTFLGVNMTVQTIAGQLDAKGL